MTCPEPGGRLQHFARPPGTRIVNLTPLGRDVRRFARQALGPVVARYGYGFQDGGCLSFAAALVEWSQGEISLGAVFSDARGNQAQHLFAGRSGFCIDSDGVATEFEMIAKLDRFEAPRGHSIDAYYGAAAERVIPFEPQLVTWLASAMRSRLGAAADRLLELDEIWPNAPTADAPGQRHP